MQQKTCNYYLIAKINESNYKQIVILTEYLMPMESRLRYIWFAAFSLCLSFVLWFVFCIPVNLFSDPISMVLLDKDGAILGAQIASDQQWRFPQNPSVPEKYRECLICFEDKRFYHHAGVDPFAIVRAAKQNIQSGDVRSGGSTITMQVIRLHRKGKPRKIAEKAIEMMMAFRLEISHSKDEILALYASNAPFGGNIVGLDAASWRYFGRPPERLSWAESAMLAVLPNSPALIHTGKNRQALLKKRNRLLHRLYAQGSIDSVTLILSLEEDIPDHPYPYPSLARHLVVRANNEIANHMRSGPMLTTLDKDIQERVLRIAQGHQQALSVNHIGNLAVLVLDTETGKTLAYAANSTDTADYQCSPWVDMIMAKRSSGSILKPFLYAGMLGSGQLLPTSLVADVPTRIGGFAPENFDKDYAGAVNADDALARSLNIPAVLMLRDYGIARFKYLLSDLGLTTVNRSADDYGLSLILGGAETRLWELCGAYSSMARILMHYTRYESRYFRCDIHPPYYLENQAPEYDYSYSAGTRHSVLPAAAVWFTFEAMQKPERPEDQGMWQMFDSRQPIAWKTGTSFGFRDAWSIGITPRFVVGVWVGNAQGHGRPGIVGVRAAAPVMFDVFRSLPGSEAWFSIPYDDMTEANICLQSGYKASDMCTNTDTCLIPASGGRFEICPYHKNIFLDITGMYRVNAHCYPISEMQQTGWFVLPPTMEWYYRNHHPEYKPLPPMHEACNDNAVAGDEIMEVVYPSNLSQIFIPRGLSGEQGNVIFEITHRNRNTTLYWHVDNTFKGTTTAPHKMAVQMPQGQHRLTVVDADGNSISRSFTVLNQRP